MIGPQVRKFRERKGWSQSQLAAKLQLWGWDTSRESITKLENMRRRVPDLELFVIARIFGIKSDQLIPPDIRAKMRTLGPSYRPKLSRGQIPPGV